MLLQPHMWMQISIMILLLVKLTITTILHLANRIPINWYAKKQATVESAMYGSEFVAARAAVDQIIGLRAALMYLDVPIRSKSFMFGDNKSVVTSSMILTSSFSKNHCMSSYHHVREAIAAKFIGFYQKDGKANQFLANIGNLLLFGHSSTHYFYGEEILRILTDSKQGVIQFQQTIHPVIQVIEVAILVCWFLAMPQLHEDKRMVWISTWIPVR